MRLAMSAENVGSSCEMLEHEGPLLLVTVWGEEAVAQAK